MSMTFKSKFKIYIFIVGKQNIGVVLLTINTQV